jgi:tRNA threonylcarbamoyladenosine biosynthesis protein TsaE
MQYTIDHPDELPDLARKILDLCGERRVFALIGDLGAGKTTLVKAICLQLGAGDVVKSPTFALVNEYEGREGRIFHFDFYRINRLEEIFDLGFEEYVESGDWCFIEWPEIADPLLPDDLVEIRIASTGMTSRTVSVEFKDHFND